LAKCVFNNTIRMNATVVDEQTMVCDSPFLDSINGDQWYNVSVTLDGDYVTNATGKFFYYRNPTLTSISPWLGPMSGDTNSTIRGTGFNQTNICDLTVRYQTTHIAPKDVTSDSLTVLSPLANVSDQVVVSISGNGQQFINDRTLHYRDLQNTFEYYQKFIVEDISPKAASNTGGTRLILTGMQFDQFKWDNGTQKEVVIQCRFVDATSNSVIDVPRNMTKLSDSR